MKGTIMPEIKYLCYFDTWNDWMDGDLVIGTLRINYDFITENHQDLDRGGRYLGDADHILTDFSEEGARKYFAAHGIPDINIIYKVEDI